MKSIQCRLSVLLFVLTVIFSTAQATDIIKTLGGGGSLAGYRPDETNLALGNSQGLAVSALGEIYFSDSGHHQVFKINPTTGTVFVVAGNGTRAYNGDTFPATSAGLNSPGGLTFDGTGNLLIVDRGNFVIRRVDALSGIITTIAGNGLFTGQVVGGNPPAALGDGGPATSATFGNIGDLAVDASGAVLVCDSGNSCVRKFTVGGNIATVAGVPGNNTFSGDGVVGGALAAGFNAPTGIVIDTTGIVYIGDSGNRRVRSLGTDNTVNTVVGSGAGGNAGFTGDGGLANAAQIGSLGGLAFDLTGNLLISCVGAGRIRKADVKNTAPIILTIAGNGGGSVLGDLGPATGATLSSPRDLAVDSLGNIYVYDTGNRRIRRIDKTTGFIDTVVGTGLTGFIGDRGPKQEGVLVAPQGSAFDAAGNLYIADSGDNAVRRIAPNGIITTFAGDGSGNGNGDGGPALLASLDGPSDVVVFGTTLFIADTNDSAIRAVDLATGLIRTYASVNNPVAIIADAAGVLYVAHGNQVDTVDLTGAVTPFAGNAPVNTLANPLGNGLPATNASLSGPSGLALTSAGELLIADTGNNLIRKIGAPPGLVTSTVAGGGAPVAPSIGDGGAATAASLNAPVGVAVDATRILIADTGNQRIRSVDLGTQNITTICGNGTPGFNGDGDVAINAEVNSPGRIYFNGSTLVIADVNNNRVRAIVSSIDIDPKLLSFGAKLNFAIDKKSGDIINGKDGVFLKAGLALPAGINPVGLIIMVDIVDLHQQVQFDSTGKQPKLVKAVVVKPVTIFDFTLPPPPPPPVSKFTLGIKTTSVVSTKPTAFSFSSIGTFREELGRVGYSDVTTVKPGTSIPVRVNIELGSTTFTGLTTTLYNATQGKSGSAKSTKP